MEETSLKNFRALVNDIEKKVFWYGVEPRVQKQYLELLLDIIEEQQRRLDSLESDVRRLQDPDCY